MRIGIDARFLTHPQFGGFKTYTANLVAGLAAVDGENEYILYIDRPGDVRPQVGERRSFATRVVPATLSVVGMPWREQILLPLQAARDGLDLLHAPALTAPLRLRCPTVITVHDTCWCGPQRWPARGVKRTLMNAYHRFVAQRAIRRAAALITVSQSAKDSIVGELGVSPGRIFVTYEAPPPIYVPVADPHRLAGVRRKYGLSDRFILGMGSADPRKNVSQLLRAYAALAPSMRERHELVVVWAHGDLITDLVAQLSDLGLRARVRFLDAVPTEDLVLLYNAAGVFVFPSLAEGFGLPPLEAMACGTPVVAANTSAMPEILDAAATLVDAHDGRAIAAAVERVLRDDGVRASLVDAGHKRAAAFSWTRCAAETVQIYRSVFKRSVG
ncbi:MAG: glycosyl transferase group 1 [Deltaproteobacteria bacterium]|jgi:glycosyltransferase involved in cell wall biosynthesis|nr:glycosyl transferase group 1 [Deltaproteobacteria bacterium]